eukprot:1841863-Alexandrium_andersonii.AAC.1
MCIRDSPNPSSDPRFGNRGAPSHYWEGFCHGEHARAASEAPAVRPESADEVAASQLQSVLG